MLIAIPLYSSTSTFCPIGKFCKVTTFSGIVQGKFLVCRTTDNRLRTTDFWAVADCSLLSVDCSHQKNRKFDVVSPASPLYITYPPYRGDTDVIYLGVGRPLGFQRRRRFSESTSLQDNKWAIAGCFKTTRPQDHK